jgi:hypothetical protein
MSNRWLAPRGGATVGSDAFMCLLLRAHDVTEAPFGGSDLGSHPCLIRAVGHVLAGVLDFGRRSTRYRCVRARKADESVRRGSLPAKGSPMSADKSQHAKGRKPRRWKRVILIALPLAAAAGGFVLWRRQIAARPAPPALARTDGVASDPGESTGENLTFLVGAVADIAVRPTSLNGPVSATAFWVRDNESRAWDAQVEQSGDGIVHVRGTINAPWGGIEDDLAIVITPPGARAVPPSQCKPPCEVIVRRVRYIRAIVPSVPPAATP